MPDISLPDTRSGAVWNLGTNGARATVIAIICNHCPYVIHIAPALADLARAYMPKAIDVVAINANDAGQYPEDAAERMPEAAESWGFTFPYCHDATQAVVRAYGAVCTPEFFIVDPERRLQYHGRFDASRPGSAVPVTGADIAAALDAILDGRSVPSDPIPAIGCSIKWK